MKRLAAIPILLLLCACGGNRYRIVEGPAELTIGQTAWTPGIMVKIEKDGRAYFGPTLEGYVPKKDSITPQ